MTRDDVPLSLTPLEFDLLVALARKPWQVFTRGACSSRCGATGMPATPGSSTSTSSACAPRSSTTRSTPRSSSPSAASATRRARPERVRFRRAQRADGARLRRDRGRRGLADASTVIRREAALARRRWRQSLQLRVVTTTMLLGLFVVSLLGGVLHEQIANSLESDRVAASESEALALTGQAQTYWDNSTSTSVDEPTRPRTTSCRASSRPGPTRTGTS